MNDALLVDRALAGDSAAREELIRRQTPRVRALCWSRLPKNGPIEDMVQETLLRLVVLLPRLERKESLGSFAAGIAIRVCADWRRASSRREIPLEHDIAAPTPTADDHDDRVIVAIRALPEIYRDVIALFYFAKHSYEQIAAALGLTNAGVNARLAKARSLLRDSLKEGRP